MKIKTRMLENERERTYRIFLKKVIYDNVIPLHHIPTKKDVIDNKEDFLLKYEYYYEHTKIYPKFIQKSIINDNFSKYLVFLKQNYIDV